MNHDQMAKLHAMANAFWPVASPATLCIGCMPSLKCKLYIKSTISIHVALANSTGS